MFDGINVDVKVVGRSHWILKAHWSPNLFLLPHTPSIAAWQTGVGACRIQEFGQRSRALGARLCRLVLSFKALRGPLVSVCLYVQPTNGTPGIGSRTRAILANKWIARRPRFSAHSDHKQSKDLHARPDQIHPDRRAAQREAFELFT